MLGHRLLRLSHRPMNLGYHCSHELFTPTELLRNAKFASQLGFEAGSCSDHFHPWSRAQKGNGFAWAWLGSALEGTSLSFGTVCAPGQRYHPAVIAQAAATLCDLYPGRFWLAVGSGEALNEHITGEAWPPKPERNARLRECVEIMRRLWAGEVVDHRGLVTVKEAQFPRALENPPQVIAACISDETARWAGSWADGLLTVSKDPEDLRKTVDAFREGGGEGKPMYLQVGLSYGPTDEEALEAACSRWRIAGLMPDQLADLETPSDFDAAAAKVTAEKLADSLRVSASIDQHLEWLAADRELGFETLYLHNVHPDQGRFIADFADRVLPEFR